MEYLDYIKEIKIGDITVVDNIFLAPMAGVSDKAFRYIVKRCSNVSYTVTEMVSTKGLVYNDSKTHSIMDMNKIEYPKVVQIFGSDLDVLKEVVKRFNDNINIDIIDLNMGCPAKKVTKNGDGSEILKDLNKVEQVIKEVMSVAKKPVTLKTRTGYYKGEITAIKVAKLAQEYGISLITIHGRTKEDGYSGDIDYDTIKKVKASVSIPVIGNGNITTIEDAKEMFDKTKVDGIMIGRAALGNPWIFKTLKTGKLYVPKKDELLNIILEHIDIAVINAINEETEMKKLRKHIYWYLKGLKKSTYIKELINKETTKDKVKEILINYFKKEYGVKVK